MADNIWNGGAGGGVNSFVIKQAYGKPTKLIVEGGGAGTDRLGYEGARAGHRTKPAVEPRWRSRSLRLGEAGRNPFSPGGHYNGSGAEACQPS